MRSARTRFLLLMVAAALPAGLVHADGAWTLETVMNGGLGANVSLTLDAAGAPAMAFNYGAQPVLARRDGSGWSLDPLSTPITALPGAGSEDGINSAALIFFVTPSLAFDPASGEPRIAYSKAPAHQVWYAEHSPSGWTYDPVSAFGDRPSLALDAAGDPHVVYFHDLNGPTYAVRNGTTWSEEPIGIAGDARSLRLDASGRPHVAMSLAIPNSDLLHAERGGAGWSQETCDTTGNTGFFASLVLDAAGEPHISYLDGSAHELRYAVRSGGTWTVETVAAPVGDACYNSLALAPDGEPFIAFHDAGSYDLRFARRDNGPWSSEPVETAGSVGEYCSLALDAGGRPHIGYLDGGNIRVRYATRSSVVVTGVGPAVAGHGWGIERLSPNPARVGEALELALRMADARSVTLELLDAGGRRIASRAVPGLGAGLQTLRWDPAVGRAGLYFLRARFGAGEGAVARLAILR